MKLKYQNGHYTYIHRRPYEKVSFGALAMLLSHAKAGSEEREVIEREIRFRKKEPKQDRNQALLLNGSEWKQTRSPWCREAVDETKTPEGWHQDSDGLWNNPVEHKHGHLSPWMDGVA